MVRHESVTTECRSLAVNTAPPATLLLLGDIMLQGEAAKKAQDQGTLYPFALVSKPFALYDRRFANLEVSITARKSRWVKKKYTFRATPAQAMSLLSLKLDVVSLANNHMLDFGPRGLTDTMTWLTKHTIAFTGAGANSKAARRGVTLDLKGTKAIFLAYNERPPKSFFATKRRPGTARLYEPQIIHDIKRLKKKDNLVFVSLHWGTEHTDIPRPYQVKRAHRLIRAGADAIIGHHPHRPQSLEMYRGKPVIYSLGNFISGFANPLYRDNIAVVLHYKKTTLKKMEVLFLHGQMASRGYRPSIITDPAQVRANFEHLKKISRSFRLKAVLSGSKMIITP
ncbi:CapA family protein [Myxococcota bacterium]|nr:CapA family protein [Myxococcota bacterium]